jgi:hypothetical protein
VEPPDGTGGEQPRPERYAGDCSLSCFTRPVTQLSICLIGASDEGRTYGSGAEAHSKRRPRRQLSNEVCWGQNRKNSNRASAVHPITDFRRCYIAHFQAAGQPYFFSNSLPIGHDAHAAKIISFLQNYECCIIVWFIWWALNGGGLLVYTDSKNRPLTRPGHPSFTNPRRSMRA